MKLFKKIWNIVSLALIAVVVILAILIAGVRLFGLEVYTVLSGSMEPEIHTGSIIYVVETDPAELKVEDVITYKLTGQTNSTHRIIDIQEENGKLQFCTKGDNNNAADAKPVSEDKLIGKVVFSIPLLGYLLNFVQQPPGSYIAIAVAAVLLLMIILPDIIFDDKEKEAEKEKEEPQKETAEPKEENAQPQLEDSENEENV